MAIRFDLPDQFEAELRAQIDDLDRAAKEALLVDLYRQERVTHRQLSEILGLTRFEADGLLKKHGVMLELSPDELEDELATLRDARGG